MIEVSKIKKIQTIYLSIILLLSLIIISLSFINIKKETPKIIPVDKIVNEEKIAYLTFDDGPSENTKKILDILDKYGIKATFFVVGESYKLKNDLLKEIINRGHNLAIHSYNHEYDEIYSSVEGYLKDFYACKDWIEKVTGITPHLYRFPGGSSTTITSKQRIQSIISELYNQGYKHVDWNVDSSDSHYNNNTKAIIENTIYWIKHNENNKIYNQTILFHDNIKKVATVEALPSVIEYCLNHNYTFKALNENSKLIQHVKRPTTNVSLFDYFLICKLLIKSKYF